MLTSYDKNSVRRSNFPQKVRDQFRETPENQFKKCAGGLPQGKRLAESGGARQVQ